MAGIGSLGAHLSWMPCLVSSKAYVGTDYAVESGIRFLGSSAQQKSLLEIAMGTVMVGYHESSFTCESCHASVLNPFCGPLWPISRRRELRHVCSPLAATLPPDFISGNSVCAVVRSSLSVTSRCEIRSVGHITPNGRSRHMFLRTSMRSYLRRHD